MAKGKTLVKGMFIKAHVDRMRKELDPEKLLNIEKLYNKPLEFKGFADYPVEEEIELLEAYIRVTKPNLKGDEIDYEAGIFHWQTFTQLGVGKALLQVYNNDIKRILSSAQAVLKLISTDMHLDYYDEGVRKVRFIIYNFAYQPRHLEGIIHELMAGAKVKATITTVVKGLQCFEYTITW